MFRTIAVLTLLSLIPLLPAYAEDAAEGEMPQREMTLDLRPFPEVEELIEEAQKLRADDKLREAAERYQAAAAAGMKVEPSIPPFDINYMTLIDFIRMSHASAATCFFKLNENEKALEETQAGIVYGRRFADGVPSDPDGLVNLASLHSLAAVLQSRLGKNGEALENCDVALAYCEQIRHLDPESEDAKMLQTAMEGLKKGLEEREKSGSAAK